MFNNPDFLYTLGVGVSIGLVTAFWLTRWMRGALEELQVTKGVASFWTSVIQLASILCPVSGTLFAFTMDPDVYHRSTGAAVTAAGCACALLSIFIAAIVVGSSSGNGSGSLSLIDYSELKQLLLRMREFRAHEIVRSAELAAKADQK